MGSSKLKQVPSPIELTESEWAIMKTVWAKEPCAAPTVTESLAEEKQWSYSTVKTLMDRMVDKGILTTEKIRNLILYRSTVTQGQAQRNEILKTVKRAFNGAMTPMMQFLITNEKLSEEELMEMEGLLKTERNKRKR
jgi:BlaI family transcriptional regulator, penicillinase repressor